MKQYCLYRPDSGQIIQLASAPEHDIQAMCQAMGLSYKESNSGQNDISHYVRDGEFVSIPEKPSASHKWSWHEKFWVDPRTLEDARTTKMIELRKNRDDFLSTFEWDGSLFDSNETRILGLRVRATSSPEFQPTAWRLADNSWRILSAADAVSVWDAFENKMRYCFNRFAELESRVKTATTKEQIESISWESL